MRSNLVISRQLPYPKQLAGLPVEVTRLARGLSFSASLEQANRAMLVVAFFGRRKL